MQQNKSSDKQAGNPNSGTIVMLAFPGAEILDIAGPLDILCMAPCYQDTGINTELRHKSLIVSEFGQPITTYPSGITIQTEPLNTIANRQIDTLIIPGGYNMELAISSPTIIK